MQYIPPIQSSFIQSAHYFILHQITIHSIPGRPIENSSRVYQVGSNLHVNKIVKNLDDGDYVCIVTQNSSGARQATPPAKLKVICKWLFYSNFSISIQFFMHFYGLLMVVMAMMRMMIMCILYSVYICIRCFSMHFMQMRKSLD